MTSGKISSDFIESVLYVYENIREMRKAKNLTQENMAKKLGIALLNYGKLERAETKLTIERLAQIAKILNVDIHELIDHKYTEFYMQLDQQRYKLLECEKDLEESLIKVSELQKQLIDKQKIIELLESKSSSAIK